MPQALRLDVTPELRAPVLLLAFEGWNDAGDAATGAVDFLDAALQTVPLGVIEAEHYFDFTVRRPLVQTDERGARRIEWPDYRLRYAVVEGRCELVTGIGAEPHTCWRSFCDEVVGLARKVGARRAILLGAFLADVLYSRPVRVTGFADPPGSLEGLGVAPTGYEGPTGIVGVLASRLAEEGLQVESLWAGLPHYISVTPNPRGTLALVQKVARLLELPLDQVPLERDAAEFEQRISRLVAEDPALAEYVRELKKREFAQ